jgi:hypothetical protein
MKFALRLSILPRFPPSPKEINARIHGKCITNPLRYGYAMFACPSGSAPAKDDFKMPSFKLAQAITTLEQDWESERLVIENPFPPPGASTVAKGEWAENFVRQQMGGELHVLISCNPSIWNKKGLLESDIYDKELGLPIEVKFGYGTIELHQVEAYAYRDRPFIVAYVQDFMSGYMGPNPIEEDMIVKHGGSIILFPTR